MSLLFSVASSARHKQKTVHLNAWPTERPFYLSGAYHPHKIASDGHFEGPQVSGPSCRPFTKASGHERTVGRMHGPFQPNGKAPMLPPIPCWLGGSAGWPGATGCLWAKHFNGIIAKFHNSTISPLFLSKNFWTNGTHSLLTII